MAISVVHVSMEAVSKVSLSCDVSELFEIAGQRPKEKCDVFEKKCLKNKSRAVGSWDERIRRYAEETWRSW